MPFATQLFEAILPVTFAQQSSLAVLHVWVPQLIVPDEEPPEDEPLEDEAPEDEAPEDEAPEEDDSPEEEPVVSPPELEPMTRPASTIKESWLFGSSSRVRPPQPSTSAKQAAVEGIKMVTLMGTSPR